ARGSAPASRRPAPTALARRRRSAAPAQATSAGEPSFSPTRSATTSMSARCLTITDIVSLNVCESISSAPSSSSARAVDRLGDRRWLLQVERADHADDLDEPSRDRRRQVRRMQADDLELVLELGVVEPQVQAAALERL